MPALVAGIHASPPPRTPQHLRNVPTWMAGTSPAMTVERLRIVDQQLTLDSACRVKSLSPPATSPRHARACRRHPRVEAAYASPHLRNLSAWMAGTSPAMTAERSINFSRWMPRAASNLRRRQPFLRVMPALVAGIHVLNPRTPRRTCATLGVDDRDKPGHDARTAISAAQVPAVEDRTVHLPPLPMRQAFEICHMR